MEHHELTAVGQEQFWETFLERDVICFLIVCHVFIDLCRASFETNIPKALTLCRAVGYVHEGEMFVRDHAKAVGDAALHLVPALGHLVQELQNPDAEIGKARMPSVVGDPLVQDSQ